MGEEDFDHVCADLSRCIDTSYTVERTCCATRPSSASAIFYRRRAGPRRADRRSGIVGRRCATIGAPATDEAREMPYERVLVALDVTGDSAESVVRRAKRIAPRAETTALHVVERHAFGVELASFRELADLQERAAKGAAVRLRALCAPLGIGDCAVLEGHPAGEIRRQAIERGADLVVVGAHGRHGRRLLLGSTANALLHGLACDVLCVHIPGEARRSGEILVAVDTERPAPSVLARWRRQAAAAFPSPPCCAR